MGAGAGKRHSGQNAILCGSDYEAGSGVNRPSRLDNVPRVVDDVPENSRYRVLLILRQINFSLFNIYAIGIHLVVAEEYTVGC